MIFNFLKKKTKPNTIRYTKTLEAIQNVHHDTMLIEEQRRVTAAASADLLKQFKEENNAENITYRKGAAFTADFGISEGWGENFIPGYIRIHPGVDRASGGSVEHAGKTIKDVVISPFNFDSSDYYLYGSNASYGFLVILKCTKYNFDFRIAHMNPNNSFIPWSLEQIKAKKAFGKNWILGSAGTYGYSTGDHTHTEMISMGEHSDLLEQLLVNQFGEEINKEYTDEFIIGEYRKQAVAHPKTSPYVKWTDDQIRKDWITQKKNKGVIFINQYKYIYSLGNNKIYTRYASNKVFKGL
jgi:murein DD-endopeptidase MepM/ murein hydrolase activator NlpD